MKLGGGSASGQGSNNWKGSQGGSGHDRWMAECADCGEEGDLLCCEVGPSHHNIQVTWCVCLEGRHELAWLNAGLRSDFVTAPGPPEASEK